MKIIRKVSSHKLLVALTLLVAIAALGTISEVTNLTHFFHKLPVKSVSTPTTGGASASSTKGESQTSNSAASQGSNQPGDNKSGSDGTTAAVLVAPSGDFVSNHFPGHNGSSSDETSVCNTSPGATCQITFTKDGASYSLPAQTTDRGGSTYWNDWTPANLYLTTGSWQITATATLGSQTQSTTDPLKLVVQ